MLKELKISNFRGFKDEVTVRFAPITILIGHNNAGKSSIIKFLLMLQQSIRQDSHGFLVPQGHKVELGDLYSLKNTKSRKTHLKFSLDIEEKESPRDSLSIYLRDLGINPHAGKRNYIIEAEVLYEKNNLFQGKNQKITFKVDEEELLTRTGNIHQDTSFLDFWDEQRRDIDNSTEPNIVLAKKINAENSCVETMKDSIKKIDHLAPVKVKLEGFIDTRRTDVPPKYVGKQGIHTLTHLKNVMDDPNPKTWGFLSKHMEEILGIGGIEFKSQGRFPTCKAKNLVTKAKTGIDHFGFGVSQCLPILVQGSIMDAGTTLMVEQPEAQIHPTAQIELGQFFTDLWEDRHVNSIIETHSGNTLLRLRRLITNGKLNPNYVSIAFFEYKDGKTCIENLRIDENGSFVPGLPLTFFGAGVLEGLKMGTDE